MKNKNSKKSTGAEKKSSALALTSTNFIIFGIAVVVMFIGYYFLSIGPAESTESLTIAPIILFIGYVILVPLAIFWRKKSAASVSEKQPTE